MVARRRQPPADSPGAGRPAPRSGPHAGAGAPGPENLPGHPAGDACARRPAPGGRLRETLESEAAGSLVHKVRRLIRRLGARARPAPEPAAAPGPVQPDPEPAPPAPDKANRPEIALDPREEERLLAQFHRRRQAREERRSRRLEERRQAQAAAAAARETSSPEVPSAPASAPSAAPPADAPRPQTAGLSPADRRQRQPAEAGAAGAGAPSPAPPAPYVVPSLDLLAAADTIAAADPEEIPRRRRIIQDTLDSFGIDAEVGRAIRGPRVTLFEVTVSRGVKVEAISHLARNLAMDLAAVSLRILAPVPGQNHVGIEVPNSEPDVVRLGSILRGNPWKTTRAAIPLAMGRNIEGADVILDLARAPHLLVAGATGSGKSVCLNSIILSLLYRFGPEDLRLILVDPKVVEFRVYNRLPHLLAPVVHDVGNAVMALRWLVQEMMARYRLLGKVGARHLDAFNSRPPDPPELTDDDGNPIPRRLPRIILIIDELADLMLSARAEVETGLARIAQLSRAVGIHAILATQRPSVNIITGIIKANFPTRASFQVAAQVDSRTILDGKGAESLLGRGDMLLRLPGAARLQRLQAPLVEDAEIEAVAAAVSAQGSAPADFGLFARVADLDGATAAGAGDSGPAGQPDGELDEALIRQAIELVVRERRASTSYLQRRFLLGYNRAAALMDCLEQRGIVGPRVGNNPREILVDAPPDELPSPEREAPPETGPGSC